MNRRFSSVATVAVAMSKTLQLPRLLATASGCYGLQAGYWLLPPSSSQSSATAVNQPCCDSSYVHCIVNGDKSQSPGWPMALAHPPTLHTVGMLSTCRLASPSPACRTRTPPAPEGPQVYRVWGSGGPHGHAHLSSLGLGLLCSTAGTCQALGKVL